MGCAVGIYATFYRRLGFQGHVKKTKSEGDRFVPPKFAFQPEKSVPARRGAHDGQFWWSTARALERICRRTNMGNGGWRERKTRIDTHGVVCSQRHARLASMESLSRRALGEENRFGRPNMGP